MSVVVGGVGCGFRAASSGQSHDDAGVDAPGPVDATAIDGSSSMACYGPPGAWQVCLAAVPTLAIGLLTTIDTDKSSLCLAAQPAGWTPAQPPACFIAGDTVTVASTTVTGTRPLVLLAQTRITIQLSLDVASHHNDKPPAMSSSACMAFGQAPGGGGNGGGGGAGGSFMTRGGNGGQGNSSSAQNGQSSAADPGPPTQLRAGCAGQAGGDAKNAGDVGGGGGAVYLVSAGAIVVDGAINASGGGGPGGDMRSGGSGGGSGGVIVLYGTTIATLVTSIVAANGGGGASGAAMPTKGVDGLDPVITLPLVAAAGGSNGVAGTGGNGFPATGNALDGNGGPNSDGGGGGGGGAGYIRANQSLGLATVSPLADIVP